MSLRIAFMGTSDFGVPVLKKILTNGYSIACVFTQTDKPVGRGKKVAWSPVKEEALNCGLEIFQPNSKDEIFLLLEQKKINLVVIASYGMILTKKVTDNYLCLNVHPSLLPRYRGPSPIQAALLNGDKETGVTVMVTEEKLDSGAVLIQENIPIDGNENAEVLMQKLAELGGELVCRFINKMKDKEVSKEKIAREYGKKQDENGATYTKKIVKEDGLINWSKSPLEIHNLVCAMYPWPGAYTIKDGKRIKIIKTKINDDGGLEFLIVQPEGKKEMSYKDYLLGNPEIINMRNKA